MYNLYLIFNKIYIIMQFMFNKIISYLYKDKNKKHLEITLLKDKNVKKLQINYVYT